MRLSPVLPADRIDVKTVVVFQGGGALGAFAAGAWSALARRPELVGTLVAVAGTSIGAVTAAAIARHHAAPDAGAEALLALWRERIATPSVPFVARWPGDSLTGNASAEHWNGFMTGMLVGTRQLFAAAWPAWQPLSGLARLQQPLHDRRAMWSLFETEFASHSAADGGPMLAVAAVDVMSGELVLFDSQTGDVTARHLAASSAVPLQFDPVEIGEQLFWDGDLTRDSLMPPLFRRLLSTGRVRADEPIRLVTVELFPRPLAGRPSTGVEIAYRVLNLMQLDKLVPPAVDGLVVAEHVRIVRDALPEDGVSGQFDYSPERVERLIEQGRAAAEQALASRVEPAAAMAG